MGRESTDELSVVAVPIWRARFAWEATFVKLVASTMPRDMVRLFPTDLTQGSWGTGVAGG